MTVLVLALFSFIAIDSDGKNKNQNYRFDVSGQWARAEQSGPSKQFVLNAAHIKTQHQKQFTEP